jgi:uncharacterized protein (TIGR03435 family)
VRTVALLLAAAAAYAQPAFEVASVRLRPEGPVSRIMGYSASGTRLTLEAYPAAALIREAYNLEFYEIVAPSLPGDVYYDIAAKAPGSDPPSRADLRRMLQTLLADRFNFRFHREPKEIPVYILTVAKGGPKFKPTAPDAVRRVHGGVHGRNQSITATRYTMADLARDLRNSLGADRPVIDRTGLTGEYDLRIEATPRRDFELGDISVHTAVQEQLGLKLESQRAPIEVLVVDRFDKPSAN